MEPMPRRLRRLSLLAALPLLALVSGRSEPAGVPPATIWRVCITDFAVPPFTYNDPAHLGTAEQLMVDAGREVGLSVLLLRYPAKRCRAMLEASQIDAMIAAATPGNRADYLFPLKAAGVDEERRVMRIHLVWIKRPGSALDWDGQQMLGAPAGALTVATRRDLRVSQEPLRALGFRIDGESSTARQMLMKLAAERVDLAVISQQEAEAALREPALQHLVVMPRAFVTRDVYAVVPGSLAGPALERVQAWWAAIGRLRADQARR